MLKNITKSNSKNARKFTYFVLVISFLVLVPIQFVLKHKINTHYKQTIEKIENTYGIDISYKNEFKSFFSFVSISNVEVVSTKKDRPFKLSIARISIQLNVLKLLINNSNDFEVISKIKIDRPSIVIDEAKNKTKVTKNIVENNLLSSTIEKNEAIANNLLKELIAFLITNKKNILPRVDLQIKQLSLNYNSAMVKLSLENALFNFNANKDFFDVDFSMNVITKIANLEAIAVPIKASGIIDYSLNNADIAFKTLAFKSPYISMGDQGFNLQWGLGYLNMGKTLDINPIDFKLSIDAKKQLVSFNFRSDKFALAAESEMGLNYIDGNGSFMYYADRNIFIYDLLGTAKFNTPNDIFVLDSNLVGDDVLANIKNISLKNKLSSAVFSGIVDLNNFLPASGYFAINTNIKDMPFVFRTNFSKDKGTMVAKTSSFSLDNQNLGELTSRVSSNNLEYQFKNHFVKDDGVLDLTGYLNLNSRDFSLDTMASNINFKSLIDLKLIPSSLSDFKVNMQSSLNYSMPNNFSLKTNYLNIEKDDDHGFSTNFAILGKELNIYNMALEWGDNAFKANLSSTISKTPTFNGMFSSKSLSYPYIGSYQDKILNISYSYGILRYDVFSKIISLSIKDMPLGLDKTSSKLNVDLNYNYANKPILTLNNLTLNNDNATFQMSRGFFEKDKGRLELISYVDAISTLRGSGDYLIKENKYNGIFRVVGKNGEFYSLKGFYDGDFNGQIKVDNFPLSRTGSEGLDGLASFNMDIKSIKNPSGTLNFNIDGYNGLNKLVARGDGTIDNKNLTLNNCFIQNGTWGYNSIILLANFKDKSISLSSSIEKMNGSLETGLAVIVKSNVNQSDQSFIDFLKGDLKILVQLDKLNNKGRDMISSSRLVVFKKDNEIDVRGLEGIDVNANYKFSEKLLRVDLRNKDGIKALVNANLNKAGFFVDVKNAKVPLPILNPYLIYFDKKRVIGIEKGYLVANVIVKEGITINGDVAFVDTLITSPFTPGVKLKLNHKLKMVDNSLVLGDDWKFNIKGSSVKLRGKLVAFPVLTYEADIVINGKGVPIQFDANGVRFKGMVDGFASYRGDISGGQLKGRITTHDTEGSLGSWDNIRTKPYKKVEVRRGIRPPGYHLSISPNEDLNNAYFDGTSDVFISANKEAEKDTTELFTIVAGDNVTFYVPNKNIPSLVVTAQSGSEANLMVDLVKRRGVRAFVETDLKIARGEINYFSNNFIIKNGGKLRMNKDIGFNAEAEFDADLKPDPFKQDVITMHFKNRIMDTYSPSFTSEPAMTEIEIMTKLGATFVPSVSGLDGDKKNSELVNNEERTQGGFETVIKATGDYAGQYLSRSVENVLRKLQFIDTVSVKTDVVSNMILDTFDQGDINSKNNNGARGIAQYLDGSSIYFGSFVQNKFFINANISAVEQDNTVVSSANITNIVPSFGFGVQIPTNLFDIDWTVATDVENVSKVNPTGVSTFAFQPEVKLTIGKVLSFKNWKDIGKTKKQLKAEAESEKIKNDEKLKNDEKNKKSGSETTNREADKTVVNNVSK